MVIQNEANISWERSQVSWDFDKRHPQCEEEELVDASRDPHTDVDMMRVLSVSPLQVSFIANLYSKSFAVSLLFRSEFQVERVMINFYGQIIWVLKWESTLHVRGIRHYIGVDFLEPYSLPLPPPELLRPRRKHTKAKQFCPSLTLETRRARSVRAKNNRTANETFFFLDFFLANL